MHEQFPLGLLRSGYRNFYLRQPLQLGEHVMECLQASQLVYFRNRAAQFLDHLRIE